MMSRQQYTIVATVYLYCGPSLPVSVTVKIQSLESRHAPLVQLQQQHEHTLSACWNSNCHCVRVSVRVSVSVKVSVSVSVSVCTESLSVTKLVNIVLSPLVLHSVSVNTVNNIASYVQITFTRVP